MPELEVLPQEKAPESNLAMRILRRICQVGVSVSSIALFCMMLLSNSDVVGRYFFLRPIEGTFEMVGVLLVIVASCGLGWCQLLKGNIMIDIVYKRFGRRGRAILDIFTFLTSIAVCVIVAWQASLIVGEYIVKEVGARTSSLGVILWPFVLLMALGFALVAIVFITDFIGAIRRTFQR